MKKGLSLLDVGEGGRRSRTSGWSPVCAKSKRPPWWVPTNGKIVMDHIICPPAEEADGGGPMWIAGCPRPECYRSCRGARDTSGRRSRAKLRRCSCQTASACCLASREPKIFKPSRTSCSGDLAYGFSKGSPWPPPPPPPIWLPVSGMGSGLPTGNILWKT